VIHGIEDQVALQRDLAFIHSMGQHLGHGIQCIQVSYHAHQPSIVTHVSIHVSISWCRSVVGDQRKIPRSLSQPRPQVVTSHWSGSCHGSKEARVCESQSQRFTSWL